MPPIIPLPATAFEVGILPTDLSKRMRERLRGSATGDDVIWRKDRQQLLIHTASLVIRVLDGWLLASLETETDQTNKQVLQFVFHVGNQTAGDGTAAACTINAGSASAAALVDVWGRDLQRVLWDAVLDGIEASVAQVSQQSPGVPVTLAGFWAGVRGVHVNIISGAF